MKHVLIIIQHLKTNKKDPEIWESSGAFQVSIWNVTTQEIALSPEVRRSAGRRCPPHPAAPRAKIPRTTWETPSGSAPPGDSVQVLRPVQEPRRAAPHPSGPWRHRGAANTGLSVTSGVEVGGGTTHIIHRYNLSL